MKLSDAIRKGCETTDKCGGILFTRMDGRNKACAVGAGLVGSGEHSVFHLLLTPVKEKERMARNLFPILDMGMTDIPRELLPREIFHSESLVSFLSTSVVKHIIWHLNDKTNMSREAIAMWVETIEDYLESQKEENYDEETAEAECHLVG